MKNSVKILLVVGLLGGVGLLDYNYPKIKAWLKKVKENRDRKVAKSVINGESSLEDAIRSGVSLSFINKVKREISDKVAEEKFKEFLAKV